MKSLLLSIVIVVVSTTVGLGQETICVEAESATNLKAPIVVVESKDSKVSGGKYLEIAQGKGDGKKVGGSATYELTLEEGGTYYLWTRVWWLDSCGNSLGFSFNGGPKFTCGQNGTYKKWHWVKSKMRLKLKAGKQAITLANREDGVKLDQILITNDKQYVPVDIEEVVAIN